MQGRSVGTVLKEIKAIKIDIGKIQLDVNKILRRLP